MRKDDVEIGMRVYIYGRHLHNHLKSGTVVAVTKTKKSVTVNIDGKDWFFSPGEIEREPQHKESPHAD